jgi:hypothetical protein
MPNINEAFPSNYLKASDLKGRSVVVTIDRVEFEAVGQSREMKPVLYFVGKEKGMVLNKTNANKIMQLLETPVTEEWHQGRILLYPTETQFQGDMVDCVRVKAAPAMKAAPKKAAPPPEPEPEPEYEPMTDEEIPF